MRKNRKQKLSLDTHTVRALGATHLPHAAGGMMNNTRSCNDGCGGGGGGGGSGFETTQCTNSFWGACQSAYC